MKRRIALLCVLAGVSLAAAVPLLTSAARAVRAPEYGVQDDAWLIYGGGTLDSRIRLLRTLGVDAVRYTVVWSDVQARPGRYDWRLVDPVLRGLRRAGIEPVVTLWGTPSWANGGRGPSWAPGGVAAWKSFVLAVARRYPFVEKWLIWNEPNKRMFLRPTSPELYVRRLLNPAYSVLHAAARDVRVGGGVTGPQAGPGGVSPIDWFDRMGRARARLDAVAHNPYPTDPRRETPNGGGCGHCETITMATIPRLVATVDEAFGTKPIWLTEYGYQVSPPDRLLGVPPSLQARYVADAALGVYDEPRIELLIHYMVRDDLPIGGWQSGFFTLKGAARPSYAAFRFPLAERARNGSTVLLWGQIRPRSGRQPYRLEMLRSGRWSSIGGTRWTDGHGFLTRAIDAPRGARVRVWSIRDAAPGFAVTVR